MPRHTPGRGPRSARFSTRHSERRHTPCRSCASTCCRAERDRTRAHPDLRCRHRRLHARRLACPGWPVGRVALVGDACGCMTPLSAQGVAMAMGGAYLLARLLSEERAPARATRGPSLAMRRGWSRRRAPPARARESLSTLIPSSGLGIRRSALLMRLLLRGPWPTSRAAAMETAASHRRPGGDPLPARGPSE
ncbi:MAG TPA: FAD-dependent monooxygenase [Candidatus Dormibacteraeota bacterium]|nr:FAD-dependent monooxygenase [Candidatus Dormibacteraeota bacterium]